MKLVNLFWVSIAFYKGKEQRKKFSNLKTGRAHIHLDPVRKAKNGEEATAFGQPQPIGTAVESLGRDE